MSSDTHAGNGTRILLVEDHQIIQQALRMGLEGLGFHVQACAGLSVDEVVGAAQSTGADVVLLDFYLEAGDSLPMIHPLVAGGKLVVMLTGMEDPVLLGRCLAAGASGIVQKAQPLDDLVRAVVDLTNGHAIVRPADRDAMVAASRDAAAAEASRNALFETLTSRERQVLAGLIRGKSAEQIANEEYVSLATVRSHIRSILAKLVVKSQLAAVALAREAGWGA